MSPPASEMYAVTIRRTPRYRRVLSWAMTITQASGGEGTVPVWRREAAISETATGRTVRVVRNGIGSLQDDVHQVNEDVATLNVRQFESLWLG